MLSKNYQQFILVVHLFLLSDFFSFVFSQSWLMETFCHIPWLVPWSILCLILTIFPWNQNHFSFLNHNLLCEKHYVSWLVPWKGVGGAVRFLVVGTIKTTTGSALDGAVFDIAQILAYLVHNMSRSQLYIMYHDWFPETSSAWFFKSFPEIKIIFIYVREDNYSNLGYD